MVNLKMMLRDDISIEEKCDIWMKSIDLIKKAERDESYSTLISEMMPDIEKNLDAFDVEGDFCEDLFTEYLMPYIEKMR